MKKTDSVSRLAKTDNVAALKLALAIPEVGNRLQALGWVLRYAPAPQLRSIVNKVLKASREPAEDAYESVMGLAWPIRALHETNNGDMIPKLLDQAIELAPDVMPTSSRIEALVLLIHAVIPAGISLADPVIDAMLTFCKGDDHWRIVRAFAETATLINGYDKKRAKQIALAMPAGKKRDDAFERLNAGKNTEVKSFFWKPRIN